MSQEVVDGIPTPSHSKQPEVGGNEFDVDTQVIVPPVTSTQRWIRRRLGLGHEYGMLKHPDEWVTKKAEYDHGADPLNLGPTAGEAHPKSRDHLDLRMRDVEWGFWNEFFQPQGDQARLSFSLVEDVWHLLTVDLSMTKVLLLELSMEALLILVTTLILMLLGYVTGSGDESHETVGNLFTTKLLLSLSTVRLSTDSVWGWREGPVSPPLEVLALSLHSWLHWLLLNIASAIVVARAMRPLRQVIFSPDCVVDHQHLNIRLQLLRFKTVGLKNLHISLSATTADGVFHNLPLSNGMNQIPEWRGCGPMNIKHDVSPTSPFHPTNLAKEKITMVRVALSCMDSNGMPVNETMSWYDSDEGVFMKAPSSKRYFLENGVKYPQILYKAKWRDAYAMYKPWPPSKVRLRLS